MSEYLAREIELQTNAINARLSDVVHVLICQFNDYDSATQFINTIAANVDEELFLEAEAILDEAEKDVASYFLLDQPEYEKHNF